MKKGLKKILAATTALALLLSMGMTAMAAEYNTVTTYDADGVHVETTVSTATTEKEYTYLVHKSADAAIADSEIVYIDQKKASSGTVLFSFDTDVDNLGQSGNIYSATVQVGSNEDSAPTAGTGNTITLENKTVTYSAVNGIAYVEEAGDVTASTFESTITFKLIPAPGYTTTGMTVNNETVELATNGTVATYTATVTDGAEYVFSFAEIADPVAPVVTTPSAPATTKTEGTITFTPNNFTAVDEGKTRQLTYFGNVANDAKEFGILVSKATFALTNGEISATEDVIKYAAAGKSNSGNFAISLYETKTGDNFTSLLASNKLYVAVYAIGFDDAMTITPVDDTLDVQ